MSNAAQDVGNGLLTLLPADFKAQIIPKPTGPIKRRVG